MEDDRRHPKKPRISTRIERLFLTKHRPSRQLLSDLKATHKKELNRIASGEIPSDYRIKALAAIARVGAMKESKILGRIVADKKEDIHLRAAAATDLSLMPAKHAERELIPNLRVRDNLVRSKVIKSIGLVGSKKALGALDRISGVKSDFVGKQLKFSKALISYRLGLEREDLPFVEGAKRKRGRKGELIGLSTRQVGADKVKNCLQLLEGSTWGIDVAKNLGFEVSAGRARWTVLLNKKFSEGDVLSSIAKRKMLTGLLTRWTRETGTYAVQYVVLTRPHNSSVDIMVVRTDGEVCYSGHGTLRNGAMTFSISDIERRGTAPTQVTGQFKPEGVEFQVLIPFGKRKGKRLPMKFKRIG